MSDSNFWAFIIGSVLGAVVTFLEMLRPYKRGLDEGFDNGVRAVLEAINKVCDSAQRKWD